MAWLGDERYDEEGVWDWRTFAFIVAMFVVIVVIGIVSAGGPS